MACAGVAPEASPVLEAALRQELEEEVAALVGELEPEARAVVALHFWEGATVREIAAALACTKSTVSRWLSGALERLRRPLAKRGFGAAAMAGVLSELLRGMEVPPPSPGFHAGLLKAATGSGAALSASIPAIP